MYITATIWLTAKTERSEDSDKISVEIDHDLTTEDLNEFVREQGYTDYKSYFSDYITDSDELNDVLETIANGTPYLIETEIDIECHDKQALEKFLLKKYQKQITQEFLSKLSIDYMEI